MFEKTIRISHLETRMSSYKMASRLPDSFKWSFSLIDALETLHKQNANRQSIRSAFKKLPKPTERLRWELSRIPVLLNIDTRTVLERYDPVLKTMIFIDNGFHVIETNPMFKDAFWQSEYKSFNAKSRQYGFFDPNRSTTINLPNIHIPNIHIWKETDSIVDWINLFVENPNTYSAQITCSESIGIQCDIRDDRTVEQNILDYMDENPPPVTAAQIHEQNFGIKRTVQRKLKKLLREDKIFQPKHGHYAIKNRQ